MSTFLGNCCLGFAALIFSVLISTVLNYKPPIGGHGGANPYGMLIILYLAGILILMVLSVITIAQNGGFDWVSPNRFIRLVIVTFSFLAAFIPILFISITLESPMTETSLIRALLRISLVVIPVILVGAGFILLNDRIRQVCPIFLYKWPLVLIAMSGLVFMGFASHEWWSKRQKTNIELQLEYENIDHIKAMRLNEIEQATLSDDYVRILEMTRIFYPHDVREAAVNKIKFDPKWPQKLLFYLENDHAREAIWFLAYNEVPNKNEFAEPLRKGVLAVAEWVRYSIQGTNPSDFSEDEYSEDATCALMAIDRFKGLGIDFKPAVEAFHSALDESHGNEQQPFTASFILDKWLANHSK